MKHFFFLFFVFSFPLLSHSQWNFNMAVNTAVSVAPYDQQDIRIASDGNGGAVVTWTDFRADAAQIYGDVYVQRIDNNGYVKWMVNGVSICNLSLDQSAPGIIESGNGSVIISWNDSRNGNSDIYAQKIDSSGNIFWAANGLPVIVKPLNQINPKMISDGAGGAIVVWQDSANGSWDIYAQRINSSGIPQWGSGVAVCTAGFDQVDVRIEADGNGGAFIVWQDKRNGVDYDIYAQRIDASGTVQWAANGIFISSTIGTQNNPKIEPDGAGGAIIAWQDKRNFSNFDIYAQLVNSAGTTLWTTNGVVICNASGNQSAIDMETNGISGAIICWKDERNGNLDIYAQRVDLNGAVQWAANGVPVTTAPYNQLNPNIVGDGAGGGIITWQDSSGGTWDVYAAKINSSGTLQWTVPVGIAVNNQTSPKNVADGTGGSIFAWQDKRNETANGFDIYAQRILADGTPASVINFQDSDFEVQIFPNPFSESATLLITCPTGRHVNYELKIYDVCKKEIEVETIRTSDGFVIRRGSIGKGIYLYRIRMDKYIATGKLIISG